MDTIYGKYTDDAETQQQIIVDVANICAMMCFPFAEFSLATQVSKEEDGEYAAIVECF